MPAWSFDNVKGKFPIGFKIWNTAITEKFDKIEFDIYDEKVTKTGEKEVICYDNLEYFSKWVNSFKLKTGIPIGWLEGVTRNDFQSQNGIIVLNKKEQIAVPRGIFIYEKNLIECCVCFAVRKAIPATWLNDRDQFLYPNDGWKTDLEFQNDCLAYTLFNNNIQSKYGINHWIPFIEYAVNSRDTFASHFMTDFMSGKIEPMAQESDLFYQAGDVIRGGSGGSAYSSLPTDHLTFSETAKNLFSAGRNLWKYYHTQPNVNINASLYDIREYFQGRNEKGTMNNKSADEKYNELNNHLRNALKILAENIEPKIYKYGFLKK
jgi:hypothetical protein